MFRITLVLVLMAAAATAQDIRRPSHCIAVAESAPGLKYLHKANWSDPLPNHTVRLQYIAHAAFLIRSTSGLNAITDFTGFYGTTTMIPDIVTMNHAHSSHWTANPDPAIPHVLRGWGPFGQGITHHLDLGDMLIRNISTDIRSEFGGQEDKGNSIFVFEIAGLCIGHLGHLHHEPSDAQYAAIGRLDVVMAPVDGGMTVPLPTMIRILQRLRSSIVIPMHWFSDYGLGTFLDGMKEEFDIDIRDSGSIEVSLRSLPSRPTVVVLRPEWLRDDDT
ncbi:MAG: MBL fold metallo-hydrolase [Rhodobacteraceae bacterium]|nr:MBL fold metallo-hydrolase [Paracoccaceae bacterium]